MEYDTGSELRLLHHQTMQTRRRQKHLKEKFNASFEAQMWKKTEPVFVFRCRFLVLLTHEVTDMLMDVIWYNKSNLQWSCSVCMSLGGVVSRKQQLKDSTDMQTDGEGKR